MFSWARGRRLVALFASKGSIIPSNPDYWVRSGPGACIQYGEVTGVT